MSCFVIFFRRKKKCIKFTSADDAGSDDERAGEKRADLGDSGVDAKDGGTASGSGSELGSDDVISVVGSMDDSDGELDMMGGHLSEDNDDDDDDEIRARENRARAARAAMPPPEYMSRTPVSVITSPGLPTRADPPLFEPPTPPQELFQSVLRSLASPSPDSSCGLGSPSPLATGSMTSSCLPLSLVGAPASVLEQPSSQIH